MYLYWLTFIPACEMTAMCPAVIEASKDRSGGHLWLSEVVATAGLAPIPLLTALKRRKDVELIPLSPANRAAIEEELTVRLGALCAEDEAVRALQRQADRICEMIVSGDVAQIDIEIQQTALRVAIARAFPEKQSLYQLLYETRFRRLWQQFHHG